LSQKQKEIDDMNVEIDELVSIKLNM